MDDDIVSVLMNINKWGICKFDHVVEGPGGVVQFSQEEHPNISHRDEFLLFLLFLLVAFRYLFQSIVQAVYNLKVVKLKFLEVHFYLWPELFVCLFQAGKAFDHLAIFIWLIGFIFLWLFVKHVHIARWRGLYLVK